MKPTEITMSLNGEPKKVKVGEEFEMGGKKWMWEYKNNYAVTLVEKKEHPTNVHVTFEEQYNALNNTDRNFKKLNPEE